MKLPFGSMAAARDGARAAGRGRYPSGAVSGPCRFCSSAGGASGPAGGGGNGEGGGGGNDALGGVNLQPLEGRVRAAPGPRPPRRRKQGLFEALWVVALRLLQAPEGRGGHLSEGLLPEVHVIRLDQSKGTEGRLRYRDHLAVIRDAGDRHR